MSNRFKSLFIKWFPDFVSALLIFVVGYSSLGFLFTRDAFVHDDHGFHFATLQYALTKSIPLHHRLIDWNPYWFAGIPELQFYPPGFTFLGAILYYLSLTYISHTMIYQALLIIVLFLPAITSYLLLRYAGFKWWISLITALFLLTYTGGASGILYGIIIGLTNSRLSLGLYFLILLLFIRCLRNDEKHIAKLGLAFSIGLSLISHPYHIFLPILAIIAQLYTWSHHGFLDSKINAKKTILYLIIGIGLSSFWWIPLLMHSNYISEMQVWSGGAKLRDFMYSLSGEIPEKYFIALYCISAFSLIYGTHSDRRKVIFAGILLTPVFMLAFLLIVRLVLMALLRNYSIDPWRLRDDFHFSIILTSGIGVGYLVEKLWLHLHQWKNSFKDKYIVVGSFVTLLAVVHFGSQIVAQCFHFKGYGQFAFLNQTRRILQADDLWNYLKTDSDGRILFTSSYQEYSQIPSQIHTHLLALTPEITGRPILGAVNEPFYATASFLYFGKKPPMVIRDEADFLKNKSLFGIPWETMPDDLFWNLCRKFNVTTVVVTQSESNVLAFMNKSNKFIPVQVIGTFSVYHLKEYSPNWISYDNNSVDAGVLKWDEDSIDIKVNKSQKDSMLMVKMGYYPRWKAYIEKKRIKMDSDETGLMRVYLPEGTDYLIKIRYKSTLAEKLGWGVTFISILFLILYPLFSFRKTDRIINNSMFG